MPKCDTCKFAHAQPDYCINCGNRDPFRRHRVIKFSAMVLSLVIVLLASFFFYQRYSQIERSVRAAELAAEQRKQDVLRPAPTPARKP